MFVELETERSNMRLDRSIEPFVILYHIEHSIIASNIEKGTEVSKIQTYLNI